MSSHTNGPWFIGRQFGSNATAIIGDGDSVICTLDGRHGSLAKADANLIAAAPELLDALESATRYMVTDVVESCNGNKCRESWCAGCSGEEEAEESVRKAREVYNVARAAIAKARGQA